MHTYYRYTVTWRFNGCNPNWNDRLVFEKDEQLPQDTLMSEARERLDREHGPWSDYVIDNIALEIVVVNHVCRYYPGPGHPLGPRAKFFVATN